MTTAAPTETNEETKAATTLFTILETADRGRTWAYKGSIGARDRDQAERLFLGEVTTERTIVAISAAGWKPHTKAPKVVHRTETHDFAMPAVTVELPETSLLDGPDA